LSELQLLPLILSKVNIIFQSMITLKTITTATTIKSLLFQLLFNCHLHAGEFSETFQAVDEDSLNPGLWD